MPDSVSPDESPLSILLVEDDEDYSAMLVATLAPDARAVRAVSTLAAALEEIRTNGIDVVLLDVNLPDSQGIAGLERIVAESPTLPVVVLTGLGDARLGRRAVELGAQDWVVKGDASTDVLPRTLRYAVERKRLVARLVEGHRLETAGRLASGVAHEFNNLLTAIAGSAQLIDRANDRKQRTLALELLQRSVRQGAALTQQLLSLARNPPFNAELISLRSLLLDAAALLQAALPSTIRLVIGAPADVVVRVDRSQFDQLMLNLGVNAKDAMPTGGTLSVDSSTLVERQEAKPDGASPQRTFVVIRVTDTGAGIDERLLPQLFAPFVTTKGAKGTGLGLTIVSEIVSRFGGWIGVESTRGKGTTFSIGLPVTASDL